MQCNSQGRVIQQPVLLEPRMHQILDDPVLQPSGLCGIVQQLDRPGDLRRIVILSDASAEGPAHMISCDEACRLCILDRAEERLEDVAVGEDDVCGRRPLRC